MNLGDIAKALAEKIEDVRINESMAGHTSFKVGGDADIMVLPEDVGGIKHAISIAEDSGCPLFVMGRGTNLLVTGKGIRGVVMKIADNYSGAEFDGEYAIVKSGMPNSVFVREAMKKSLGGAEFLGGIPGTIGGAACMNAGAYGGEICEFIEEVYLLSGLKEITFGREDMGFGYRKSIVGRSGMIVTGARLKLKKISAEESKKKLAELNAKRREKQPLEYPSAGSTFKRPPGYYAGTLIEQAGLKGLAIGGAQVSEKHAGFIINKGGATPDDIIGLIEEVQESVEQHSGVRLETEVRIVGER